MKSVYLILTLLFMNIVQSQEKATTLYFIRHSEKADNSRDTELSEAGKQRAQKWAAWFKDKNIAVIYTTPYRRTTATVLPLVNQNSIELRPYNPTALEIDEIMEAYKGQNVLIVGHSNTIPKYLNILTGKNEYKDIDEDEFGLVYTVTIQGDKVTCTSQKI